MKIKSEQLISDLTDMTVEHLEFARELLQRPGKELNRKRHIKEWSALECLEHLNLYGDFYLPEMEQRISGATQSADTDFKPGFFGNYFADALYPSEKLNKMKTFKNKNPLNSDLDKSTIERFIAQQEQTLKLLERAKNVSLNKVKTGISIPLPIKIKLGDTFKVVIYHNYRHIKQAERAMNGG